MHKIYNKLVRDRIPLIMAQEGSSAEIRVLANDKEYLFKLCDKLLEEAHEVIENPSLEELADVSEVIRAIGIRLGYSPEDIDTARKKKAQERGGFNERIYLISTNT